jgi:hypothetical protein
LRLIDPIVLLELWWRTPLTFGITPRTPHVVTVLVAVIHFGEQRGPRLGLGWVRLLTNLHDPR